MNIEDVKPEEFHIMNYYYTVCSARVASLPAELAKQLATERALTMLVVWRIGQRRQAKRLPRVAITAEPGAWTTLNNEAGKDRSEVA